ncbi:MAG: electron transfer flavoprotein subunit beta/FixA family protein [Thermomicrobiales bacterium]
MAALRPLTIAVLIKQVPDMNAARVDRASGRVVTSGQLGISSYDRYAIEAALRLKEAAGGGEIVVVALGPATVKDAISRALAMGADRGIHLETADPNEADTLAVAAALAEAIAPLNADLVLAGQTSDDYETGQVGAQVAALANLPVISNVVSIEREGDEVLVRRDMEDGYQRVRAAFPLMILASTGLDEPRVPSVKGIMGAKKKPVEVTPVTLPSAARLTWETPYVPPKTTSGIIIQDVPASEAAQQLVAWLQEQKLV